MKLTLFYVNFIICYCLKLKYVYFVAHLTCCVSKEAIFSHTKFCEVIVRPQEATNKITPCSAVHKCRLQETDVHMCHMSSCRSGDLVSCQFPSDHCTSNMLHEK